MTRDTKRLLVLIVVYKQYSLKGMSVIIIITHVT